MLAYFVIDFFVARVRVCTQTLCFERRDNVMCVIIGFGGNRANHHLLRCQPQRHFAGIAFDHNADEPLQRAQHRAVQHDRHVLFAILANIARAQTFGQHKIQLQRAALPGAPNGIAQVIFNLRPVKRALARQLFPLKTNRCQRIAQAALGPVPHRVITGARVGPQGQLDRNIVKAEVFINLRNQPAKRDRFINNLVFAAENMRVILRHLAHPHQPVQRAMGLIAVATPKFGHTNGQVAIAFNALFENLHMRRTIHRLQSHQIGVT